MAQTWGAKSVKELEGYLKERGVGVSGSKKATLIELCIAACELQIEVDPDGLVEDRAEVINNKLTLDGQLLTNPTLLNCTHDMTDIPRISIIDIYNYLVSFADYDDASFRDYHRMEAYSMKKDGYVIDLTFQTYPNNDAVFAVRSKVKPRTREKDPVTKLPHYNTWVILKKDGNRVHSSYCTCKGG